MTKKPVAIAAATLVVAGAAAGGIAIAAGGQDPIGDLDADLVGNTVVMTVEASAKADAVRLTYGGQTLTAQADPGDGDDGAEEDRDYVARFPVAQGDQAGSTVRVQVATTGGDADERTLTDRLEAETADDDDAFSAVTPDPAASAAATASKPRVGDLDVDLVRGDTLVVTVEARDAKSVKLTYGGTTRTATLDRDDAGDRDRDWVARFPAAQGDRADNTPISIRAAATNDTGETARTLTDRVDAD